ncbi:putative membrane protein [Anaerotaenia torta]
MTEKQILKLGTRQLFILFVLPILPAIIIGVSLIVSVANNMQHSEYGMYSFPIFENKTLDFSDN